MTFYPKSGRTIHPTSEPLDTIPKFGLNSSARAISRSSIMANPNLRNFVSAGKERSRELPISQAFELQKLKIGGPSYTPLLHWRVLVMLLGMISNYFSIDTNLCV